MRPQKILISTGFDVLFQWEWSNKYIPVLDQHTLFCTADKLCQSSNKISADVQEWNAARETGQRQMTALIDGQNSIKESQMVMCSRLQTESAEYKSITWKAL
jgi:hypothetical protein